MDRVPGIDPTLGVSGTGVVPSLGAMPTIGAAAARAAAAPQTALLPDAQALAAGAPPMALDLQGFPGMQAAGIGGDLSMQLFRLMAEIQRLTVELQQKQANGDREGAQKTQARIDELQQQYQELMSGAAPSGGGGAPSGGGGAPSSGGGGGYAATAPSGGGSSAPTGGPDTSGEVPAESQLPGSAEEAKRYLLSLPGQGDDPDAEFTGLQDGFAKQSAGFFKDLQKMGVNVTLTSGYETSGHSEGSKHYSGQALDFVVPSYSSAQAAKIGQVAQKYGLTFMDEYANPSAAATGPHFHIQGDGRVPPGLQAGSSPKPAPRTAPPAPAAPAPPAPPARSRSRDDA